MILLISFKSTMMLIILGLMAMSVAAWLVWEAGKRNVQRANEYEVRYSRTKRIIDTYEVNERNYDLIIKLLEHLGSLEYKDLERTHVLTCQFFQKYKTIAEERASEYEFSPQNVFGK